MTNVRPLEWDSNFFGLKVGRADISAPEDSISLASQKQVLKNQYDLIYVFGNQGLSFEVANANMIDKKVVFFIDELPEYNYHKNVMAWPVENGLTDDVLQLALESGKYSRFKLDGKLPAGSYERLYTRWIEQSVKHSIATEVFCYMIESELRGLMTIELKDGVGTIGLVAIHPVFQHRGIGTSLLRHVIRFAHDKRCEKLYVATQLDNEPACHLYKKCGMVIDSITQVWHWWL